MSGEDVTTLETSGEDVTTLETSGEDAKIHSKRVGFTPDDTCKLLLNILSSPLVSSVVCVYCVASSPLVLV